ncbi:MAG: FAD-dependent oxidoreductase [Anaerolineaceae bacterium]|nr:FAD-dependent oxidoreductase [Anaerolineaceae bacterium]
MSESVELVVIGAGPAGIEAAVAAAQAGAEVTLIDSSPRPGGQYFKQISKAFQSDDHTEHQREAQELFQKLASSNVRVLQDTLVWGIFEGAQPDTWLLTLHGSQAPARLSARAVVIAAGAYDRSIPFPGWDLPGVMTAGAVLTMIKNQRVLPGRRVLLSGTGPLQLEAAAQLVEAGAEVVGVLESASRLIWRGIPYLPALWGQWARMREGWGYLKTLAGARVPYRLGWSVIAAHGEERVNEVVFARLDPQGRPILQSRKTGKVDTVVAGYSLTPSTELFRLLDCEMIFDSGRGGFLPRRNENLETSREGIYAAGDCAGIGGAPMSRMEGRIAGCAAALRLGHGGEDQNHQGKTALRRERRFAKMLGDLFSPPAGLYTLAKEDTILCRCEQVTLGQIREAFTFGAQTITDVKNITRSGMGNCQGRTCGSIIAQIMAAETNRKPEDVRYYNIRPPVHPVPLEVIEEHGAEKAPEREG